MCRKTALVSDHLHLPLGPPAGGRAQGGDGAGAVRLAPRRTIGIARAVRTDAGAYAVAFV